MSSAGVLRDIHTSGCEIPLESTVGSTCQVLMYLKVLVMAVLAAWQCWRCRC
jgi:hypothetical protein